MEIAATMTSPSQMPQALAETNPACEAGAGQGKGTQQPRFGLIFDQWAGMAGGKGPAAEPGDNKFPQAPMPEGPPAERATGVAQDDGPSREPLTKVTDSFTAGLFTMAMAVPDNNFQIVPKQTLADSGASGPEKGESHAAAVSGESSGAATSILWMLSGMQQSTWNGGNPQETATGIFGGALAEEAHYAQSQLVSSRGLAAPAATAANSAGFPAENPHEAGDGEGGTDLVAPSPFALGNPPGEGVFVKASAESSEVVRQQGTTQATQQGDLLQTAGRADGNLFQGPAVSLPAKAADQLAASATGTGLPGTFGKATGSAMKTGVEAVTPQAQEDVRASRDILSAGAKGTNKEAIAISIPKTGLTAAESRIQGVSSETAGDAYRAAATDAAQSGKKDLSFMAGNLTQVKPSASQELSAANTGKDLSRMEIVLTAGELEDLKETGSGVTRKTGEIKTADNSSAPALVTSQAELRATGESRMAATSPDAKRLLGEQITNQIREKLDARGHAPDNGQITLKLHPEELGELKINMRMADQHLKIEITTQNPSVKEALMQNIDTLKETLSRQNIAMDRFDVSAGIRQGLHQGGGEGRQMTQDGRMTSTGFQRDAAIEDDVAPGIQYSWQNENSLVNVVL